MPATEPLFATVSLLLGDVLEMTLRVPITDETTVRLLAKETMQRLLARQRNKILRNGQCFSRETIAVTDVFVNDGSNKAEVFAQDLVTQVIRVKDEVVYMHLQIRDARKQEGGAPVLSDVSAARTAAQDTPSSASSKKPSGGKSESVKKLSPVATPNAVKSSEKQKTGSLAGTKRTATQMNEDGVKNKQSNAKQQGAKRAAGEGRLGWGPEAHKLFPDNYVSSPNRLMTKTRNTKSSAGDKKGGKTVVIPEATAPNMRSEKPQGGGESTSGGVSGQVPGRSDRKSSRLGWGYEAGKFFPENYVGSPDKIPRLIRMAKQLEEKRLKEEAQKKARENIEIVDSQSRDGVDVCSTVDALEELSRSPPILPACAVSMTSSTPGDKCEEGACAQEDLSAGAVTSLTEVERQLFDEKEYIVKTPSEQLLPSLARKEELNELDREHGTPDDEKKDSPPSVALPPGWGREAARYFDPETYIDDPRKAKSNPNVPPSPVRARRIVSLPPYLGSLDA